MLASLSFSRGGARRSLCLRFPKGRGARLLPFLGERLPERVARPGWGSRGRCVFGPFVESASEQARWASASSRALA